MNKNKRGIILLAALALSSASTTLLSSSLYTEDTLPPSDRWICQKSPDLNPNVLKLALEAYQHAQSMGLDHKGIMTVIDYSKLSDQKRLWVIDFKHRQILFDTYVAHGKGSGNQLKAVHFSNHFRSDASSLGTFLTGDTYDGKHGYSLRIRGLEPGFNDNAYRRELVVHKAWYVSKQMIRHYGYIGRSWGCLAISPTVSEQVIDTIKDGTIIFSYYPDEKWLRDSEFLKNYSQLA